MKRREALALSLERYVTGKACVRGHFSERSTRTGKCIECDRIRSLLRYSALSLDARRAKGRERYWADIEKSRERGRENRRRRYWANLEKERARDRERKRKLYSREARRLRKVLSRKRKTEELFRLQRGRCAYCRTSLAHDLVHVDHIHPRARGGTHDLRNLQLTCAACNIRKGAKPPEVFARQIGMLV